MRALALLGLALVVLVAGAGGAVGAAPPGDHSIVVSGDGSVQTVPDRAQLSLGVSTDASTASAALRENSAAIAKVIAAVKARGIEPADIQTEQISLSPRYDDKGSTVVGYTATNSVSVTLRALARVGPVVDAAVAAGANQVDGPNLVRADADELYRQALRAAVANARAKAQAIADASGLTLGPITDVAESAAQPPVPADTRGSLPFTGPPVEPGTQLVEATLTVTFAAAP